MNTDKGKFAATAKLYEPWHLHGSIPQQTGKMFDGGSLKQRSHRNLLAEFLLNPRHQSDCHQRVSAQRKEIVFHADWMNRQQFLPQSHELKFHHVSWRHV